MSKELIMFCNRLKDNKREVAIAVVLVLCAVVAWIVYSLKGHPVVASLARGGPEGLVRRIPGWYSGQPVEFYDSLVSFYAIVLCVFALWFLGISLLAQHYFFKKYLFIYLVLGTLVFLVRLEKVEQHYNILDNVFCGTALAPNAYRMLVPTLAFFLKKLVPALSWLDAARIWNFLFILCTFPLFHVYLGKWFEERICLLVTITLGCLLPLSFWFDYPSDFLELSVFIIGYTVIRDRKEFFLYPLIFLATINRETAIFLAGVYFISAVERRILWKVTGKTLVLFILWFLPFAGLRALRGIMPYRCSFIMIRENVNDILNAFLLRDSHVFSLMLFLGLFVIMHLVFYQKRQCAFLKRNTITIAVVLVVGFCIASIKELRIFYPIVPPGHSPGFLPSVREGEHGRWGEGVPGTQIAKQGVRDTRRSLACFV